MSIAIAYAAFYSAMVVRSMRGVGFYENGIHFPAEPSGTRERFIPWNAIERYHWDDDVLTVVPAYSVLSAGGGTPLTGGSVKVPMVKRVEAERLLAQVAASRNLA